MPAIWRHSFFARWALPTIPYHIRYLLYFVTPGYSFLRWIGPVGTVTHGNLWLELVLGEKASTLQKTILMMNSIVEAMAYVLSLTYQGGKWHKYCPCFIDPMGHQPWKMRNMRWPMEWAQKDGNSRQVCNRHNCWDLQRGASYGRWNSSDYKSPRLVRVQDLWEQRHWQRQGSKLFW